MKLPHLLLTTCTLLASCSGGSHGGGSAPNPLDPGAPLPDGSAVPTGTEGDDQEKPLEPLVAASLDELVALVAPNFNPEAATEDQISDSLETVGKTFSPDGVKHLQQPRDAAVSTEDDPDLENGGTCKGLYNGFVTMDLDWWTFDASHVRDVIRYGIKPIDQEDLKREVIAEHPAYATISYRETRPSMFYAATRLETMHLGKAGDQVLMVSEELLQPTEADEASSASIERCARLLDFKTKTVAKACSTASYNSNRESSRTDRQTSETLTEGAYDKSDRESQLVSGKTVSWNTELKQTGADTESFTHDFRSYYTSEDAGIFFGSLFSPYAYATGELKFTRGEGDPAPVKDCTVTSVRFAP